MKHWFEVWFDSPYYPILYSNRSSEEAGIFLDKLLNVLNLHPGATILDVGCGRGRHSIYLSQKNYKVSGIDISTQSILKANESLNPNVEFFVHDMRRLFRTNYYDCALNLFTSFGYFENDSENLISIQNIAKSIKPSGILVLDYLNVIKISENLKKDEIIIMNNIKFTIHRYIRNNFIYKEIFFNDKEEDFHFVEKVGLLNLHNFQSYFSKSGLKGLNLYGSYQLDEFNPETSDRLIIIAAKES